MISFVQISFSVLHSNEILSHCRYLLVLLSVYRYINIVYKHSSSSRFLEHYRGLNVIICALISLCWSLPPLLNVGNTYTDESIGFHCSLD
jgi:hypothetical protein